MIQYDFGKRGTFATNNAERGFYRWENGSWKMYAGTCQFSTVNVVNKRQKMSRAIKNGIIRWKGEKYELRTN